MPFPHTVRQGECLSSIAARYGFADWHVIYDHPDNADFKKKRPNPNVICAGDRLVIPDKEAKEVDAPTGKLHRFKLKRPRTWIRIEVKVDEPHRYEMKVGDEAFTGTTDGSSPIEHRIPADAEGGEITVWPDTEGNAEAREGAITWALRIGHLDPIEEVTGVQGRLLNLGHYGGELDGDLDFETAAAIRRFQESIGEEPDGELTDALRDKLRTAHDGA